MKNRNNRYTGGKTVCKQIGMHSITEKISPSYRVIKNVSRLKGFKKNSMES
jgi:hypothetical protein